jgi:twitching motility protein PilT
VIALQPLGYHPVPSDKGCGQRVAANTGGRVGGPRSRERHPVRGIGMSNGSYSIGQFMMDMGRFGASDLHVKVGIPPAFRVGGELRLISSEPLTAEGAERLLAPVIPAGLRERLERDGGIDFAAHTTNGERFRVNVFRSGGHLNAAIRRVKNEIPTYETLHLPPVYRELVERTNEGLVIVCGTTGSGKSTTLAAMVEHINQIATDHIITIEDPVEYQFSHNLGVVSQREVGVDVPDYATALRYIVRQDPDVIMIGEMRDYETVRAAVQAAETGHLVFGSLHTGDALATFNRVLEFFPQNEHGFIRSALATSLKAICAQRLLPAVPEFKVKMVPATEVLLVTPLVRDKIREGHTDDLPAIIGSSASEGMRTFTQSLAEMVLKDWVTLQTAMSFAPNQDALASSVKGVQVKNPTLVHRVRAGV